MRFPWVIVRGKVVVLLSVTFSDRLERKRERLNPLKLVSGEQSYSGRTTCSDQAPRCPSEPELGLRDEACTSLLAAHTDQDRRVTLDPCTWVSLLAGGFDEMGVKHVFRHDGFLESRSCHLDIHILQVMQMFIDPIQRFRSREVLS